MTVISEWSFPVFISTHELFVVFFLPCPAEEESDGAALVGTWCSAHPMSTDCSASQNQGSFAPIPCYQRKHQGAVVGSEGLADSWKTALIEQIFMDVQV